LQYNLFKEKIPKFDSNNIENEIALYLILLKFLDDYIRII